MIWQFICCRYNSRSGMTSLTSTRATSIFIVPPSGRSAKSPRHPVSQPAMIGAALGLARALEIIGEGRVGRGVLRIDKQRGEQPADSLGFVPVLQGPRRHREANRGLARSAAILQRESTRV